MRDKYIITETQNGKEIQVFEFNSFDMAIAVIDEYTEKDKETLIPCIYRKLANGILTTEY